MKVVEDALHAADGFAVSVARRVHRIERELVLIRKEASQCRAMLALARNFEIDERVPDPSILLKPIEELELSVRTALRLGDGTPISEIVTLHETDLLRRPGFGRRCLRELRDVLAEHGLRLGMSDAVIERLLARVEPQVQPPQVLGGTASSADLALTRDPISGNFPG